MRFRGIFYTFTTVLLCACQSGYTRSPVVTPHPMLCDGNLPAQIVLYSPEEARLDFQNKSYQLNRIETAAGTGIQYGNRSIGFAKQGINTVILKSSTAPIYCTDIPKNGL